MNELFDLPESKSPRLLWTEKHGIKTSPPITGYAADDEDDMGNLIGAWYAYQGRYLLGAMRGQGDTEDEAITQLALKLGIKLWNEEGGQP